MDINLVNAKKVSNREKKLDDYFFVISKRKDNIEVECYKNVVKENRIVSGKLQMIIVGDNTEDVGYAIIENFPTLSSSHYIYLGRELQKCFAEKTKYEQG